jgi:hypothetical protein
MSRARNCRSRRAMSRFRTDRRAMSVADQRQRHLLTSSPRSPFVFCWRVCAVCDFIPFDVFCDFDRWVGCLVDQFAITSHRIPHSHHTMSTTTTSSSSLKFIVGGNGKTISVLSFDPASKSVQLIKSTGGYTTPSWIESSVVPGLRGKAFTVVGEEMGQVQSLELKDDGSVEKTGWAPTGGNPAHGKSARRTRSPPPRLNS